MTVSRNVSSVIDRILISEGGVADVGDGMGITRFGQTPIWLEDWGFVPPGNVADAAANYEAWMHKLRLDEVVDKSPLVGYFVTDFAVMSGHIPAIKALQEALGVTADGVIGPQTLGAFEGLDAQGLALRLLAARGRQLGDAMANKERDNRKFARGWMNRFGEQLEELAETL